MSGLGNRSNLIGGQVTSDRDARAGYQNGSWRPSLVVNFADPVEESDEIGYLGLGHVLLWHQPAMALFVIEFGRVAQIGLQILRAALLRDLGQVRRIVGALSKQRVAIYAIVLVPDIFAMSDRGRNVLRIGQLGKLAVAIDSQHQEGQRSDSSGTERKEPCLPFVQVLSFGLDVDAGPVLDADIARIDDADGHQNQDEITDPFQCSVHNRRPLE